jgi:oligopeptide transport system substrate-binding protein
MSIVPVRVDRRAVLAGLLAAPVLATSGCGGRTAPADTLRVGLKGGPDSLDPLKAEFAAAALLFRQFYLPLVGYGPNAAPAPTGVAASWTPDAAYVEWTFAIRPGLAWSDGQPLTATDVLESLRLGADPKTAYADASELYSIAGYQEAVLGRAPPADIAVTAPDEATLVIRLKHPDSGFASRMQEFYPVPMQTIAAHGVNWTDLDKIVVSGPYKPVTRTQTRLEFEKNPLGGWIETMPARIEVEAIEDDATRLRMFQSGDLDLTQDPPLLRAADFEKEFGARYQRFAAPRFIYMSMNTKRPALADARVRRALSLGFDRGVIARNVMRGAVEPMGRFVRGEEQPAHDPEAARALLAEAGHTPANPLRFELLVTKDDRERAAIQMVDMWKRIGVEVTLFAADSSAIVSRLNNFDFDAAIVRLDKGMKSDPVDLMASWGAGGTAFSHQWKNPAFDAALDAARAEGDPARRKEKVLAAEKFLLDEAPVAGVWFFPSSWFVAERVGNTLPGMPPIIWPGLTLKDA